LRDGDFGACLVLDSRVVQCFTTVGDLRHACQQLNVGYDEMLLGASARAGTRSPVRSHRRRASACTR
jgi:hypothetical protein